VTLLALGCALVAHATLWGGDHVELETTEAGARIEFDCAHGTIDAALTPDAQGAFRAAGTFTPERAPGPSRDQAPPTLKATYSGTIEDDRMTLRVDIDGQDVPRRFTLTRGTHGALRKCK